MLVRKTLFHAAVVMLIAAVPSPSSAGGRIDANTLIAIPHGTFNGVQYTRYEAMFEGVTSNGRPYRVPCQIIAPSNPGDGSGLLLFDWLVPSTIVTAVGQEQADARYTMTDDFLFGLGLSYATVRCDPAGIGKRSPISDPTRPWSDGALDTSSEFITSAGDEFDIVVDYVKALRTGSGRPPTSRPDQPEGGVRLFGLGRPPPRAAAAPDGDGAVRLLARWGNRQRIQPPDGE